jgi:hypothetical protein
MIQPSQGLVVISTGPFVLFANGGTEDVARRCDVRGDTKHWSLANMNTRGLHVT